LHLICLIQKGVEESADRGVVLYNQNLGISIGSYGHNF
jgi:hypothetical protein